MHLRVIQQGSLKVHFRLFAILPFSLYYSPEMFSGYTWCLISKAVHSRRSICQLYTLHSLASLFDTSPSKLLEFFVAQIQSGPGNIPQRFWSTLRKQHHTVTANRVHIHDVNLLFQNISKVFQGLQKPSEPMSKLIIMLKKKLCSNDLRFVKWHIILLGARR